jgi:hypothetical protein
MVSAQHERIGSTFRRLILTGASWPHVVKLASAVQRIGLPRVSCVARAGQDQVTCPEHGKEPSEKTRQDRYRGMIEEISRGFCPPKEPRSRVPPKARDLCRLCPLHYYQAEKIIGAPSLSRQAKCCAYEWKGSGLSLWMLKRAAMSNDSEGFVGFKNGCPAAQADNFCMHQTKKRFGLKR